MAKKGKRQEPSTMESIRKSVESSTPGSILAAGMYFKTPMGMLQMAKLQNEIDDSRAVMDPYKMEQYAELSSKAKPMNEEGLSYLKEAEALNDGDPRKIRLEKLADDSFNHADRYRNAVHETFGPKPKAK